jgi:hypothetical protein
MTDKEAMKLALEALIWTTGSNDFGEGGQAREGAIKLLVPAITAVQAALAQPEQEPVFCEYCGGNDENPPDHCMDCAQPQPAQEPMAWLYKGDAEFDGKEWRDNIRVTTSKQVADWQGKDIQPLYTTPHAAQRPWVEPTVGEWWDWWRVSPAADETEAEINFADFLIIAQAVMTKLKEHIK